MLGVTALGSGSKGNAFVIHSDDGAIMIDAGFTRKRHLELMEEADIDADSIMAMLLTHEHEDHVRGCRLISEHFDVPVYATFRTVDYLKEKNDFRGRMVGIHPGSLFTVAGFAVTPFAVQHDAVEPVGYIIEKDGFRVGIATDLGCVNTLVRQRLKNSDVLILESNYDLDMLWKSQRQLYLKRRIIGKNGHLDNADALAALDELVTERTAAVFLVHVSEECNSYSLVEDSAGRKLHNMGRGDILLRVVKQACPTDTFRLHKKG